MDGLSSVGDVEEMVYIPSGSSTGLDDFERFYKLVRCLRWEILGEFVRKAHSLEQRLGAHAVAEQRCIRTVFSEVWLQLCCADPSPILDGAEFVRPWGFGERRGGCEG